MVPELRRLVSFSRLNLMDESYPYDRDVDIVFLRNVLIYFDLDTKRAILRRARQALRPDGFLLLGSAETTVMVDDAWERVVVGGSVAYRAGAAALRAAGSAA